MSESDLFRAALAPITERTEGEMLILLTLRRCNSVAQECVKIAHRLGWTIAKADWRTLFACGLIRREGDRGFIALTPRGLHWQQRIAFTMAQVAGLHFLMPHGEDRFNVTARCTCGWSASLSKNQGHLISGQFRAFGQHKDAVAKGVWKKPRSVEEIFEATMARCDTAVEAAV